MFQRQFFLVLFFFASFINAYASPPPGLDWFTLSSAHFRVHHTAEQANFARSFAIALERALPKLTKDLQWVLPTPVDIVLNDSADSANGLAISYPNTHLEVFTVPFDSDSVLMDYQDWVEELATHELTHLIANDTISGAYTTLRKIFGSWVKPNGLQAPWLVEGLAVYEETKQTKGGRGRSVFTEAFLRAAAAHNELASEDGYRLDRFNDGYNWWWPVGNAPYILGYAALAGLHASPGALSVENSQIFPYMPNTALENTIGKDWYTAWAETGKKIGQRYGSQAPATDESNPAFCRITHAGQFTGGAALGKEYLYFSVEDPEQGSALARISLHEPCGRGKIERLVEKKYPGPAQVSVSADEGSVLFTVVDSFRNDYMLNDIYLYKVKSGVSKRLSFGERLSAPAFLDSGEQFVAVHQLPGNMQALELRDIRGNKVSELYLSKNFERLANPFSRGNSVFFSLHNNQGQEEILVYDLAKKTLAPAIQGIAKGNYFTEKDPYFAEGYLYYIGNYPESFANSFDVYRYDLAKKKISRVAQSASGLLLHPVVAGQALIAASYTQQGMDLYRIDLSNRTAIAGLKKQEQDLHQYLTGEPANAEPSQDIPLAQTVPYSASNTAATSLWPQYWMPQAQISYGGALLGASTSGNDPLDYHQYAAQLLYDTRASFPSFDLSYLNRQNPLNFQFTAEQYNNYLQSVKLSNRVSLYSAEMIFPSIDRFYFSLGTLYQSKNLFYENSHSISLFHQLQYSDIRKSPSAIAPNRGALANFYLGVYPATHSEDLFVDMRPSASVFLPGFLPSHSLSVGSHLAITTNRLLSTNYFLGGGASSLSSSEFVVRGYPQDVLFGQKIGTMNFAYTLPISRPYSGWRTNPVFLKDFGMRFLFDMGTSNYFANYNNAGDFIYYKHQDFAKRFILGTGLDFLLDSKLFYYIPVELSLGIHRGLQKRYGGESILFLGLDIGTFGNRSGLRSKSTPF